MQKTLYLANPRGFCAGVQRAIATVERALALFGAPIYVRHEIVHNTYVIQELRQKGAIFVDDLNEVPKGSTLIFSAHGVPKSVEKKAQEKGFRIFDATCPLVNKVHMEVDFMHQENREIIVIGHGSHPEVEGTMGQLDSGIHLVETIDDIEKLPLSSNQKVAYVTQTTLSVDETKDIIAALKKRFSQLPDPVKADICYATTNRQEAVKKLAQKASLIFVVGSKNSSNTNRLCDVAQKEGALALRVDSASEIDLTELKHHTSIGLTAGASVPEVLVKNVIHLLEKEGFQSIELEGISENLSFPLPRGLGRR